MKANENEILTIAGKLVKVEYKECRFHPCGDCCLDKSGKCLADRECLAFGNFPGKMAYFVPAKESVDRWVVTNAFLKCDRAGKIVSEMYGDKLNNLRNRDKYLAFLTQVNLDDRFGELAEILQRYGAMQEQKEQPEADFDELIKQEMVKVYETYTRPDYIEENTTEAAYDFDMHLARHFAEWGAEHLKK